MEDLQAYLDYYGISAEDFVPGYDEVHYPDLPPEISWEAHCLYNDKEPYDDY